MLTTLTVQNLVVVREVEVEFSAGLTVLTGETGAGKSILIEALSLALGERADSQLVRHGAERAVVTASFDLTCASLALDFLQKHALDDGKDCILRRVLNKDGRSRAFCNASPVSVATLRELGTLLVDIHSQHASQRLLQRDYQRHLLDEYGRLDAETTAVRASFASWKKAHDELAVLAADGADRARMDLLRYQVEEMTSAGLDLDELASIEGEFKKLANSSANLEHCARLRASLAAERSGSIDQLDEASSHARALAKGVPEAANLSALLEQASIALGEALDELDQIEAELNTDPQRVSQLDQRLSELHNLARKHRVGLTELGEVFARLQAELESFDKRNLDLDKLRANVRSALASYNDSSAKLSSARAGAAKKMAADISARMRALGIPHATFAATLAHAADENPQPHGRDRVEFCISTNPAQAPGALSKVASGGELSRVTLAIQAATAEHTGVPVAVYDEVDTGIGGNTANIVGQSLRDVARHSQVICITHSPQVASAGDQHLLVDKQVVEGQSATTLRLLDVAAREREVARMLGAAKSTKASLLHARDLIARARN